MWKYRIELSTLNTISTDPVCQNWQTFYQKQHPQFESVWMVSNDIIICINKKLNVSVDKLIRYSSVDRSRNNQNCCVR